MLLRKGRWLAWVSVVAVLLGAISWNAWRRRLKGDLATAVQKNETRRALSLINAGISPNQYFYSDENHSTVSLLAGAATARNWEVMTALLDHGARPDPLALREAIRQDNTELALRLIRMGVSIRETMTAGQLIPSPINIAADRNNLTVVQELVSKGASVNTFDMFSGGATPIRGASRHKDTRLLEYLLERGAQPNVYSPYGLTPLHIAIQNRSLRSVQLLLKAHCDPETRNSQQQTALMFAAQEGDIEMVRLLLSYKAKVNVRNKAGETALKLA